MTNIVKVRASVFIPTPWTDPRKDEETGNVIHFEGDSREFTPYAVNAMRSRVEQEVVVDFYKKIFSHMQILVLQQKKSLLQMVLLIKKQEKLLQKVFCALILCGALKTLGFK